MARIHGPVCRLCRREGIKLYLKSEKCYTDKCPIERRGYPPGQHGQRRSKVTEYGKRLREKQRVRKAYGLLERQFSRYFTMAEGQPGATGDNLVKLLEQRLDNVVYRLGLAPSRRVARQFVRHGHVAVNGRSVMIPSALVKLGEPVSLQPRIRQIPIVKRTIERIQERGLPPWVETNFEERLGHLTRLPAVDEVGLPIQPQLIVEFYSR